MKQETSAIQKQYRKIIENSDNLDLNSYQTHKRLEEALRKAGIERPRNGPRISDPAHTRGVIHR